MLIAFCRLRDMSNAIASAREAILADPSITSGALRDSSSSRFVSRHIHPQDKGKSVEVHHLFIDLST